MNRMEDLMKYFAYLTLMVYGKFSKSNEFFSLRLSINNKKKVQKSYFRHMSF